MTNTQAKIILRNKGWSVRRAAEAMGYHYTYLAYMLTGRCRLSRPAARGIFALHESAVPYRKSGFAAKPFLHPRKRKHTTSN